jgi:ubiquinone/menaquinone biosynthesis C-methylase UbiE
MTTLTQWNQGAKIFDEHQGEAGDTLNKELIFPVVEEYLGDLVGLDVWDAGCGSGYVTRQLAQTAKSIVGTDFSSEFISICKEKQKDQKNVTFAVADISKPVPFGDNQFDRILCKMVLQYVPDISVFVTESARVLKQNGRLIVVVDHPFHVQLYYAQQCLGVPNTKYPDIEDYFSKTPKTKLSLWNTTQLTWYPRTVSDYIQPFLEAKLVLTDIREVAETDKTMTYPRILALCFKK